jgi:hypothetical protein
MREIWAACAPGVDLGHLVFVDESGVHTAMSRRCGRGRRGRRVVDAVPAARGPN